MYPDKVIISGTISLNGTDIDTPVTIERSGTFNGKPRFIKTETDWIYELKWYTDPEMPGQWRLTIEARAIGDGIWEGGTLEDDIAQTYTPEAESDAVGNATISQAWDTALTVLLYNHGYSDTDTIYVDWLNGVYYVADSDTHTFKLSADSDLSTRVLFSETVYDGYVRQTEAVGTETITGLGHLEGEYVLITSGGEIIHAGVVENGEIDTGANIALYQVGKPYKLKIRTTRFAIPGEQTVQTRIKNINETTVRHIKTIGGKTGQEVIRDGVVHRHLEPMNATFSNRSRDAKTLTQGGYCEDGFTLIESDDGMPMTVLATIVALEVTGD